jgi:hypothetical protein
MRGAPWLTVAGAVDKKITKRLTRRSLQSKKVSPFFYL